MKLELKRIEKHSEGRYMCTLWFERAGEEIRTKLTEKHFLNLAGRGKIPLKLRVGDVLNVCERVGYTGLKLYYVYGYEEDKALNSSD